MHVVIIGFGVGGVATKFIADYDSDLQNPTRTLATNINPYLVEGNDVLVVPRSSPFCAVPVMVYGSKPADGGNFIVDQDEHDIFVRMHPIAAKYLKPFVGGVEFINGSRRYCLWLKDVEPGDIRTCPELKRRVGAVQEFRLASKKEATRRYATQPTLFAEIRQPEQNYLAIPEVSSERRRYIPMAFLEASIICSNKLQRIEGATIYHFGILTSRMHMAWTSYVCGRLKSDYNYSSKIVYNNFPWPSPSDAQKITVEACAQAVLDARAKYPDCTLADLYDPLSMPPELAKAHAVLDRAVEKCYRPAPFASDRERVEYLFALYEKLVAPLAMPEKKKRGGRCRA